MPEPIPPPLPHERPPLTSIEKTLLEHEVVEQLRKVYDPELPVNVYDLGLIYDIQVSDNRDVHIVMTLTSPACPVAGQLPEDVRYEASLGKGVGNVTVELSWDPPFTIDMMSEEAKLALGFM